MQTAALTRETFMTKPLGQLESGKRRHTLLPRTVSVGKTSQPRPHTAQETHVRSGQEVIILSTYV